MKQIIEFVESKILSWICAQKGGTHYEIVDRVRNIKRGPATFFGSLICSEKFFAVANK